MMGGARRGDSQTTRICVGIGGNVLSRMKPGGVV